MRTPLLVLAFAPLLACRTEATEAESKTVASAAVATASTPAVVKAPPAAPASKPAKRERRAVAWADEVADYDQRIASARDRSEKQPSSFLAADTVANLFLSRARLTGDYTDYQHAEEWVGKAFAADPKGKFGPFMTRASVNYTLHRLDRVDDDFARAQLGRHDNISTSGFRQFQANLALQRGQYDEVEPLLRESIELHESVSNLASLAYYLVGTGRYDDADATYAKAIGMYHGATREPRAWLHLQLGLADLGRGRHDEALAHYRDAEGELSGYWLVDEHIAEILTLTGKTDEAKAMYLDIIERTGNPEFMDAMAGILLEEGKSDEAKAYIDRAGQRFAQLTAMYPEAAYGHALEHYLEFGSDPKFTLDLAERNHALRPNCDAKVLLAQAYVKADRLADAETTIVAALATPWTTADLHATAAEIYRKRGKIDEAAAEDAKARAINPKLP